MGSSVFILKNEREKLYQIVVPVYTIVPMNDAEKTSE